MNILNILLEGYKYIINILNRNKYKLNVAVDRALFDSVTEFFDLPEDSLLPVLEDIYCEKDLKELKRSAVQYDKNESTDLLKDFMNFENKGVAVLMWPEGPPSKSNYWMPDDMMTQNGMFIRDQLRFKKEYQKFVDKIRDNFF